MPFARNAHPEKLLRVKFTLFLLFLSSAFFVFSWLSPNHYLPWRSAHHEFIAFAAVLTLFASFCLRRLEVPFVFIPLFLLALVPLIQFFAGIIFFWGDAIVVFLFIICFSGVVLVSYNISREPQLSFFHVRFLMAALVAGAFLSLCISLMQWLRISDSMWIITIPYGSRPSSNIAQSNNFATLLGMGLAGVLYFYERKVASSILAVMLGGLLLFGLALTQSRTGVLALTVLCVFWIIAWRRPGSSLRLSVKSVFLIWVFFIVLVLCVPILNSVLLLGGSSVADRFASVGRLEIYQQFYHAIKAGPFWGHGWAQIGSAQVGITPSYPSLLVTEYSHNIFLDLLIWNGPLLGGLILLFLCLWVLTLLLHFRAGDMLAFCVAVGFFLVHCLLEYPHAYAYLLMPVGLMLGILQGKKSNNFCFHISKAWNFIFFSVVFGLCVFVYREYQVVEAEFKLIRLESANIVSASSAPCQREFFFLTHLSSLSCFAKMDVSPSMSNDLLVDIEKTVLRFPNAPSIYKYGFALGLNAEEEKARYWFAILRGLYGEKLFLEYVGKLKESIKQYPQLESLVLKVEADDNIGAGG